MSRGSQQADDHLEYIRRLTRDELWKECAERLNVVIQAIIEFAKLLPMFQSKLDQDDQIVLLKTGCFELSCLRMSRYFDLNTGMVLFGDSLISMDAFITSETTEMKLVTTAFEFAKGTAEMKLTEAELALFSAFALLAPDRPGLKGVLDIQRLNQAIAKALKVELGKTHKMPYKGDVTVLEALMAKLPTLRELSLLHMESLSKFRRSCPHLEFPALHKELFSVDL